MLETRCAAAGTGQHLERSRRQVLKARLRDCQEQATERVGLLRMDYLFRSWRKVREDGWQAPFGFTLVRHRRKSDRTGKHLEMSTGVPPCVCSHSLPFEHGFRELFS